jgi:hypothetical protein
MHYLGGAATKQLFEDLAWLGLTAYASPQLLPTKFWKLHSSANLSAVGANARPITCGDTIRRLYGRLFYRANAACITALPEPLGQFNVAVGGGVQKVAALGQLLLVLE